MEDDISGLYDNWFIETCQDWVIPYIGDLLGVRGLHSYNTTVFSQRAWVANMLAYRRRKGTAPVLEQLARDITGWPVRVVEFFQLLSTTQYLNHLRLNNFRTPDLRDTNSLDLLNTPFENATHSVDVRRIASIRGKYNISNIGIFLWRLQNYEVKLATARRIGPVNSGQYTFNPLGLDAPLFNNPKTETEITHLAQEINVPGKLRRRALYDELENRRKDYVNGILENELNRQAQYFGFQPVLQVINDGNEIPASQIVICNLENWRKPNITKTYKDSEGNSHDLPIAVAVDPQLGRINFPEGVEPEKVQVSYSYGFNGDVGAGPYNRIYSMNRWNFSERPVTWQKGVTKNQEILNTEPNPNLLVNTIQKAVNEWNNHVQDNVGAFGAIVILDSDTYDENITGAAGRVKIPPGSKLAIIAGKWPQKDDPDSLEVKKRFTGDIIPDRVYPHILGNVSIEGSAPSTSDNPGEIILDGLLIEGKLTIVNGNLGQLRIAHCSLVPGEINKGLVVNTQNSQLNITLDHTISGAVEVTPTISNVSIMDSIVDAKNIVEGVAVKALTTHADMQRSTFFGAINVKSIEAGNCLFNNIVEAERRQLGCVRFCYLPQNSSVPKRYRCQPDLEINLQIEEAEKEAFEQQATLTNQKRQEIMKKVISWMVPTFTSVEYGQPGYGQLRLLSPAQIRTGAEDGSELGVFSFLKQPQRETNLRSSMDEFLRFGREAGIFFVT